MDKRPLECASYDLRGLFHRSIGDSHIDAFTSRPFVNVTDSSDGHLLAHGAVGSEQTHLWRLCQVEIVLIGGFADIA